MQFDGKCEHDNERLLRQEGNGYYMGKNGIVD